MARSQVPFIGWDPLRVDLLWGLREPARRGPKPALTVAQIARTGIQIADEEGLAALSMQRIARELGVGTMTLYTYIPDKNALLEVMFDLAFEDTTPSPATGGWREFLEQMATATMAAYERHPWALQIFVGGPPLGPSQLRFLEAALQALADTGLTDREKLQAVMSVSSLVRGAAHIAVGISAHVLGSGLTAEQLEAQYAEAYTRVLTPEEFPATLDVLAATSAPPSEPEADDYGFEFGLRHLLDGIERRIESSD